jgi:hypothetical protein
MKSMTIAGAFAIALASLSTPAAADGPMDVVSQGCDYNFTKHWTTYSNCFRAYEPYKAGLYGSLKCSDPNKGLRYVTVRTFWDGEKSVLRCMPL